MTQSYITNLFKIETIIAIEICTIDSIINKIDSVLIKEKREMELVWRIWTCAIHLPYKLHTQGLFFFHNT